MSGLGLACWFVQPSLSHGLRRGRMVQSEALVQAFSWWPVKRWPQTRMLLHALLCFFSRYYCPTWFLDITALLSKQHYFIHPDPYSLHISCRHFCLPLHSCSKMCFGGQSSNTPKLQGVSLHKHPCTVPGSSLQGHRTTAWFGWKRPWGSPRPNPCHRQGHLPPDQAAQCPIQPGPVTMAQKALREQEKNVICKNEYN